MHGQISRLFRFSSIHTRLVVMTMLASMAVLVLLSVFFVSYEGWRLHSSLKTQLNTLGRMFDGIREQIVDDGEELPAVDANRCRIRVQLDF